MKADKDDPDSQTGPDPIVQFYGSKGVQKRPVFFDSQASSDDLLRGPPRYTRSFPVASEKLMTHPGTFLSSNDLAATVEGSEDLARFVAVI